LPPETLSCSTKDAQNLFYRVKPAFAEKKKEEGTSLLKCSGKKLFAPVAPTASYSWRWTFSNGHEPRYLAEDTGAPQMEPHA
jgi:hypothetical protein